MPESLFRVPPAFGYVAAFSWAVTGAVVGVRKQLDIVGLFVVALLSSMGGSLIRDAIFLQTTPILLTNWVYLPLIALATLLVSVLARRLKGMRRVGKLIDVIDAVGIPSFAVIGMQLAQDKGIPVPGVMLVGVANGLGGGLLRDMIVGDVPSILRPGQFMTLSLVLVCGLFLAFTLQYGARPDRAAYATVALFFIMRVLTIRFNWRTRSVGSDLEFEE